MHYRAGGRSVKITKIEPQKRNKKRVSVYIDDRFAFGIHEDIAYRLHIQEGTDIDKDYIENVLKTEEQNKANTYALNLLSFSARTEKQIRDKMSEKEYESSIINNTIEFLTRTGLLNDSKYAENFAKDKANFNKYGNSRIKFELYRKGVSKDIVEDVISNQPDDEYERALEVATKKILSYKNDDKNAVYRKMSGFLQRKGYSYDIVSKVMKELLK
jgi:regulatory protein